MLKIKNLLGLCLLLCSSVLFAAIDAYQFNDLAKQARFQKLSYALRCPKCQNQNIADSNATIAKDLRTKMYQMLQAGKTDQDIIDYMVARYGDFVLYEPKVKPQTYLLWYGPGLLLILGLIVIVLIIRSRRKSYQAINENQVTLSDTDAKKLNALLKTSKGNK